MTCGIYKITNKINGKSYIGKSINAELRMKRHTFHSEHIRFPNKTLYKALEKYGKENFSFDIIETDVPTDKLNEREQYWIAYYDTVQNGYNETIGGDGGLTCNMRKAIGKLTDEDVKQIRTYYQECKYSARKVYSFYQDKISRRGFNAIWQGYNSPQIMPEVFTDENKQKHQDLERAIGSVTNRKLSLDEIKKLRVRSKEESLYQIWKAEYQNIMSYSGFRDTVIKHHADEEDWYYEAI